LNGVVQPKDEDDMFFVPQTRPQYERDIIGAPPTHSTNRDDGDFNPFQDRF
jgi:hypothetical protein